MIVTLTTTIAAKTGHLWFPFEVAATSIEELYAQLVLDGVILGSRLETDLRTDGKRVIRKRVPYIIGKGLVGHISPPHVEIVEA